jgi:hypothetical protein
MVGGAGYVVHSLASFYAADTVLATALVIVPAALGELAFTGWLLLRGINLRLAAPPSTAASGWAGTLRPDLDAARRQK